MFIDLFEYSLFLNTKMFEILSHSEYFFEIIQIGPYIFYI